MNSPSLLKVSKMGSINLAYELTKLAEVWNIDSIGKVAESFYHGISQFESIFSSKVMIL